MQRIGIVGVGNISKIYLDNLTGIFSKKVKLIGVSDIVFSRAEKAAAEYKIKAYKVEEMIKGKDVDIILNITPPKNHFQIAIASVKFGKHVYNEKPLCIKQEEADELLKLADEKGLRVGCAPDTFLGAGIQTCRKIIDDGWIGKPVAAAAAMMSRGPEHWHPDPHFFYKDGGGPLFDIGPYYITALVNLLGPIGRVSGSAKTSFPKRTITNQHQYGQVIDVEVPTHIAGVLDFKSGPVGLLVTSFDVYSHSLPRIEIYGSEGTIHVPDPNTFGGPVLVRRGREEKWNKMPLISAYSENSRGLGITEMAEAIEEDRPHRASGELASHVLDVMHGLMRSSETSRHVKLKTRLKRPNPLDAKL